MKITAWRIFQPRHAESTFTGEGARRHGGRWNSKGVAVIYTAGSQSLAALEMLVHLSSYDLLATYQLRSVTFDHKLAVRLNLSDMPADWQSDPAPMELRLFGSQWARQLRSAVLRVPSAIVPTEFNYLLNPAHPDFGEIALGDPVPFEFDPRLIK